MTDKNNNNSKQTTQPNITDKSIVESLACHEPIQWSRNDNQMCAFPSDVCIASGERKVLTDSGIKHGKGCPYRQAVELLAAPDDITADSLNKLGYGCLIQENHIESHINISPNLKIGIDTSYMLPVWIEIYIDDIDDTHLFDTCITKASQLETLIDLLGGVE